MDLPSRSLAQSCFFTVFRVRVSKATGTPQTIRVSSVVIRKPLTDPVAPPTPSTSSRGVPCPSAPWRASNASQNVFCQTTPEKLSCRNRGLRVHRPAVTTVTPRIYSTIYVIQPPSSLSAPIPPPAAHDRQDAASHMCRSGRYPGVLAQLERDPPVDPTYRRPRRPFPEPSSGS